MDDDSIYSLEPPENPNPPTEFHQYFIDNTINQDFRDIEIPRENFFATFKSDMLSNVNNIFKYEKQLRKMTKKPYYLLHSEQDFYVARETFGNVWYICYRDLMMIDVDIADSRTTDPNDKITELSQENIDDYKKVLQAYCDKDMNKDKLFMLFRSKRGIHVFLVSHKMPCYTLESLKLMLDLKGDVFHSCFSYLRGYCARLNKKNENDLPDLYEFIGYVGYGKPLKSLMRQAIMHIDLIPFLKINAANSQHVCYWKKLIA